MVCTRFTSSILLTGLEMKSSVPALRLLDVAGLVQSRHHQDHNLPRRRVGLQFLANLKAGKLGIITSSNTRSGLKDFTLASVSCPSMAVSTMQSISAGTLPEAPGSAGCHHDRECGWAWTRGGLEFQVQRFEFNSLNRHLPRSAPRDSPTSNL